MSLPEDRRESSTRSDAGQPPEGLHRRAYAEEVARNELFNVWRVPHGRFPLLTLLIVLIAVTVTGLAAFAREPVYRALFATPTELWVRGKWWGIFGSVFLHADIVHLLFNCYWVWLFGRVLEIKLGLTRYLGVLMAAAWLGSLAELAWSGRLGVGLSGVAYALFGFLVVNRSYHREYEHLLSGNTVVLFLGWLVACFPLTYFGVLNVANFAHLGGLIAGLVLGSLHPSLPRRRLARIAAISLGVISFLPLFWAPWHEPWQVAQVLRAINRNQTAVALARFAKVRASNPGNLWALDYEVSLRLRRGEYAFVRDLLSRAVANPDPSPALLNSLAWLLATCPLPEVRDGVRAVELAKRACADTAWENAAVIDTLAAAYAEVGNFEEAESVALKALALPGTDKKFIEEHLEAFRARQPWREPAASSSENTK